MSCSRPREALAGDQGQTRARRATPGWVECQAYEGLPQDPLQAGLARLRILFS